ncbi:hypothetical protein KRR38_26000 [Novosphingobium sp. G106]|uniref:hypothetical protein n=1 Tax=Novosphingobium sp. G106 TaxID=2849500 RepID=UPI001C2DB88F|nr:hypothetical protein [Novosphingobium sp. G106]MBV1691038.1 hypothetical protein [Novosphingobium sp. G106]
MFTILLWLAAQAPEQDDLRAAYGLCFQKVARTDPVEPDVPAILAVARSVQKCAAERRAWREWLIANHVPTYLSDGEAEADLQLAEFEARFVTLYADPARQARPIADDRGILGGYFENLDASREKKERPKN